MTPKQIKDYIIITKCKAYPFTSRKISGSRVEFREGYMVFIFSHWIFITKNEFESISDEDKKENGNENN